MALSVGISLTVYYNTKENYMLKFKQAFLIMLIVFLGAVTTQFLVNLLDKYVFESMLPVNWSTAQIIWNSATIAVLAYFFAWLIPLNRTFGLGAGSIHVINEEERYR